ncbi:MAG: adenosylmethionine--8-amino-7-oxononanoate transaminase [Betaproteobacteria bacterium]|nr:adenosylmethionine--8-amino-7-oxononanoate transaminase [Betaproteobacteria bacterium]
MANRDIVRRSLAAVWHPCTQMKQHERFPLVPVARASGAWLEDFEANRFVDGVSSWWVNLFGHSHPAINAAIAGQLETLEHAMLAGFTHEPVVQLSERLAKLAPGRLGHAFYASDGASATEIALKMACHYQANRGRPDRNQIVYLEGGYHGETLGALSVTDVPAFREAYSALLRRNLVTPFPARHAGSKEFQGENSAIEAAQALAKLLESKEDSIAAIIVEPMVQGASGMRMYHPLFLRHARELATKHGILLIADEIMTGFGRTGTMFAWEQVFASPPTSLLKERGESGPDLMCLSKGITGGYLPLSCVLSTDEVYGAFYDDSAARAFLHSHSYTGNPLACRAACAVLDLFEEGRVLDANRVKAARFDAIAAPLAKHPAVRNWRRLGMIWAFEVAAVDPEFSQRAFEIAMRHRALLRPIGNTVYFMPPYVTDEEAFAVLVEAGTAIADELGHPE